MFSRSERIIAVLYGILCHALYAASVSAMIFSLYFGMAPGLGTLSGVPAYIADGLLVLQFPILHSLFLSRKGRPLLRWLAPAKLGRALETTTYASIAGLQVLLSFAAWSPLGPILWEPHGWLLVSFQLAYMGSWLLLAKAMSDAGLAVQTGFLGWSAVARNQMPTYERFQPRGTFRLVRHPIYWAFTFGLWTGPVWTPDHLMVAIGWTLYCVLGPVLKDNRYLRLHGSDYRAYIERMSYWLPTVGKLHLRRRAPHPR